MPSVLQWSGGSMIDCGDVRGLRTESHRRMYNSCVCHENDCDIQPWVNSAFYPPWDGKISSLKLIGPFGSVRVQPTCKRILIVIKSDDGCINVLDYTGGLTAQVSWFGLTVVCSALHSSSKPGELMQQLCHHDSTINCIRVSLLLSLLSRRSR